LNRISVSASILASVMILMLLPAQIYALPVELQSKHGDVYVISTISGYAKTWNHGQPIVVPCILEMKCRVTEVTEKLVLFKIECGTLKIDETKRIIGGWWRGIYHKGTEKSMIEATAIDETGARRHFILFGDDARHTPGGTYMTICGGLKDSDGKYWKLSIRAWRFKAT
jgi:hypothetical protein